MSALFHLYLCGRKAAEWLINMDGLKIGEIVICLRYEIHSEMILGKSGLRVERHVGTHWFNRKAKVVEKYVTQNHAKYKIEFLDDGNTLAWLDADELVVKNPLSLENAENGDLIVKIC